MQKLFYYPSARDVDYDNPYSVNYKNALTKYFLVLNNHLRRKPAKKVICLLQNAFFADIFIFNWIENICQGRLSAIKYRIVQLAFLIIKLRKRKIVWMFHNFHPHQGSDKYSEAIMSYMFGNASIIISHSKAATEYARQRAKCDVKYECHPVAPIAHLENTTPSAIHPDILIWGTIAHYKGIVEFLSYSKVRASNLNIFIVGRCKYPDLENRIRSLCNDNICYENRKVSFSELKALISNSKYVLFPYIGSCVSSSGALIDTIVLGGTPIGPDVGAFKDLSEEGVCLVYDNYDSLLDILSSDNRIDAQTRNDFIAENSWQTFACKLVGYLKG
ncbi:MAG: hypothetical protein LUC88_10990 [Prevotella sp.]|nr:hypothetical protein [Prevotella sp.]